MESRGDAPDMQPRNRPAIARRSCDQCRSRKIGCDRGSPCSNCISGRLDCTHSTVASKAISPKQRILISTQYEQKIDDIARNIDNIKHLLDKSNVQPDTPQSEDLTTPHSSSSGLVKVRIERHLVCEGKDARWDHSAHIIDFVKNVVHDRGLRDIDPEERKVLASLQDLLQVLEDPTLIRNSSSSKDEITIPQSDTVMPPLEATVAVLRWAKAHANYVRMKFLAQILSLDRFSEICRKVYFAVDDYTEIEFILANSYLSNVFSECFIASGLQNYREYCCLCQKNLHDAFVRLPLILTPSMEVVAALALGTFNAIENSKGSLAWTFVSTAANFCQTLGYHRLRPAKENDSGLWAAKERLFWIVYRIEKGLSLRFGRSSNIRDAEVTLSSDMMDEPHNQIGRLQGQVYEQLYSPTGLSRPNEERRYSAETLAQKLREFISEKDIESLNIIKQPSDDETDPVQVIHVLRELVCQKSLLTLVLWAIPSARSFLSPASDQCVTAAREVLQIHHQCMIRVRQCRNDPYIAMKYINWALLHIPFVPFSILFTRAVQLLDLADLVRLESFAASLQPDSGATAIESITHPYRLYKLLCQAARLYIDAKISSLPIGSTTAASAEYSTSELDFSQAELPSGTLANASLEPGDDQVGGLGQWYYGNQQLMGLLDEDMMF